MTYGENEYLLLSGIQHYSFCRRQWALIHIENQWKENALTAEGMVAHERVHDKTQSESRGDELTVRGMPIKSESMGISGECDAVVFTRSDDGIVLHGRKGKWSVLPIEYKHGKTKISDCDRLQATAQAMCLEEMYCCRVDRAALFYFETRSREYVEITEGLREAVKRSFSEMHALFDRGYTPKVKPSDKCRRCSLCDLCLPSLMKKGETATDYILQHLEDEP